MSSLYSWPGSRRCACRSTKPGSEPAPAAVDDARARLERSMLAAAPRPTRADCAALDDDVDLGIEAEGGIDRADGAKNEQVFRHGGA